MDIRVNRLNSPEQAGQRINSAVPGVLKVTVADAAAQHTNREAGVKIDVRQMNFWYGPKQALFDLSMPLREQQVTALIGPSGCGKTTFLRTLNRMNDLIPGTRTEGQALLDG